MAKEAAQANETIARAVLDEYQPKTVAEMQDALKGIFGPMFEAMLQGDLIAHLGCESNERGEKETSNRRNGYGQKTLNTTAGPAPVRGSPGIGTAASSRSWRAGTSGM